MRKLIIAAAAFAAAIAGGSGLLIGAGPTSVRADHICEQSYEWPTNRHTYTFVCFTGTWVQARADAESRGGHLATLTSVQENDAVDEAFDTDHDAWIGGYQPNPGVDEPVGGWAWVTGEPWSFTAWASGEPNDVGGEDFLQWWLSDGWNDASETHQEVAYILEVGPAFEVGIFDEWTGET